MTTPSSRRRGPARLAGLLLGLLAAPAAWGQAGPGLDFWFSPAMFDNLNPERETWPTRLDLVSDRPANVVITGLVSWTGTVAPGAAQTIDLNASVSIDDDRLVVDKGIHVTSDVPISAVWRTWLGYYDDGVLLVPTERLGYDYRILTHPSAAQSYGAGFVVTATEDATTLEYQDPCSPGGTLQSVSLDAGQTFMAICQADPNGAIVRADRPIAVTSVTHGEYIPFDRTGCCADPVLAQLWPVGSWGTEHRVPKLPKGPDATDPTDDVWIVAYDNNVLVDIESASGLQSDVLAANAPVKYELEGPLRISSSSPIQVLVVFRSWYVTNEGDPYSLLITPESARLPAYRFVAPSFFEFTEKLLVTVVAEDPGTAGVTVDGVPAVGTWLPVPGTNQAQLDVQIDAGEHFVEAARPVSAYVHGYYIQQSFAFPAAASLELPSCVAEARAQPLVLCPGEPAVLDGSASSLLRCSGSAEYRWSEEGVPLGGWSPDPLLAIDPPVGDTTYTLELRCSDDFSCLSTVDVPVRRRPDPPIPGVGSALRVLRADTPDGYRLRLRWTDDALLGLEGEHYHVFEAATATGPFLRLDPDHALTDDRLVVEAGTGLRFYDLRRAEVCESLSADDFPHDRPSSCHGHGLACGHSVSSALESTCAAEQTDHDCAPGSLPGVEREHALELNEAATVRFELQDSDPSLVIVVHGESGDCLAAGGPIVEAALPAGRHRVLVDSPLGRFGDYTLHLSCTR